MAEEKHERGRRWVCEPSGCIEPLLGDSGAEAATPRTVIDVFRATCERHGYRAALALKRPDAATPTVIPKEWLYWTWSEYWTESRAFAKALHALKVGKFGIVNVLGFNSPEWFVANMGAMMAGGICAGIYVSNSAEACHYVTQHSRAEVVAVDGNKQLAKYAVVPPGSLPHMKVRTQTNMAKFSYLSCITTFFVVAGAGAVLKRVGLVKPFFSAQRVMREPIGRAGVFSSAHLRPISTKLPYCTPLGQVLSQLRQVKQRSK